MYKQDLALNNLQQLICHKTKPILLVRLRTFHSQCINDSAQYKNSSHVCCVTVIKWNQ